MDNTEPRLTRCAKRKLEKVEEPSVDEDIKCTICLDTLNKSQCGVTMLPCGHAFHSKCMMENILKNNLKCPMCRRVCARVEEEEESSDDDMDENIILMVADRIRKKLKKADVHVCLTRFHIPNGTTDLTHREACELLAEQLTHETDDEDETSA